MPAELFKVKLTRDNPGEKWGFAMTGGKDQLLVISEIEVGGVAEQIGLTVGDVVVQLNNDRAENLSSKEAGELLTKTENQLELLFIRNLDSVVEDPRYQGLQKSDRKKVGFHDVLKPVLRKDWNCPWVKRDGKGLKQVVRNYFGTDPVPAPVKTSHNHFYSEPQSILAPEPSQQVLEELEKIIQEKMAQEAQEKQEQQAKARKHLQELEQQQQQQQQQQLQQQQQQQQHRQEVEVDGRAAKEMDAVVEQHRVRSPSPERDPPEDEEDLCPALETVETQIRAEKEEQRRQAQREEEARTQAVLDDFQGSEGLLREIAKAIQASMEQYQGCSEGFEPSADELIDVLKNLENLAAANPALYRAIVDQIKVHQQQPPSRQHEQHHREREVDEDQEVPTNGHDQQHYGGQEEEFDEEEYQRRVNGNDELDRHRETGESCQMEMSQQQYEEERSEYQERSEEQFSEDPRKEAIRRQVEREHEEQMRQLQMRRAQEPPKTITVVAGSKNRPAWPIAPGIDNGTVPRTIELTASSAQQEEEMLRSRLEVAQAAGLRHVEVINGDETFYPQPMKGHDYPWAGSLRPVSNKLVRKEPRRGSGDPGSTPWSGSLRHVDEKKKKSKPVVEDDLYGDAPWMGTLRHVKQEAKVFNAIKPQFKRYPDEDAPNPYSGMQGCGAKPCYPLTPAAVISASGGSKEERERAKQDEEVDRIRSNLRETRAVSSSMLRALMPKLLKEHQNKVEPLDHMESIRIMEEILGMQIGLNTAQIDDDNEEAEAMIRACGNSGDVDLDLDALKKLEKKKKPKKKKPTSKASTKELAEIEASS